MDRRNFARVAAAGLGGALSPSFAPAQTAPQAPAEAWAAAFARAQGATPWTLGFRTAAADFAPQAAAVEGRFPRAVTGVLYRNGPAVHELGGQRYRHWFDGDGMVQRLAISATSVSHSGSVVRTPKYSAETAAGRRLRAAFGSQWPGLQGISAPDSMSPANTSVLPLAGEVLALWEGGSAQRLDAQSLRTLGPKHWRDDLHGAPFSAHPRSEPDGTIWNFGLSPLNDTLVLYQIDRSGGLRRAEVLPLPDSPMLHDFAVSARYLVFLMPPLVFSRSRAEAGSSFLDSQVWRGDDAMRVLVVDKADWSQRRWLELPPGFLFHVGNAWDDGQGRIQLDYVHAAEPTALLQTNRELMRGRHVPRPQYHIARVSIDLHAGTAGTARQDLLRIDAEFPRIDPRLVGRRHGQLFHLTRLGRQHPGFCAVGCTDLESGRCETFDYGDSTMAEEHLFVAEPGSAPGAPGWLLGTALDLKQRRTLLSCFRSDRLADGPVAQATLPLALPLGLHGAFVPAA